uniref:Uncharacterized protein n=1 Tax=Chromera velia CCMP2878 TaxID=1169474 RepID=A0A0G4HA79_9ALVE|eukprot:Cvel_25622.t1-p1 / transcript=Cvel_25622.t1 / gene=Cvel_25622 / organism=Chromera_velia_CCMP2878 / gene_product=Ankyrin homolog, putative / transcript_product=Ankyrin homolog, putative / location=Cvel_scaffold2928:2935-3855(-) / protein_length=307 / sequence_SO=supercontig / SO=protein_coding / is_pseudo=false
MMVRNTRSFTRMSAHMLRKRIDTFINKTRWAPWMFCGGAPNLKGDLFLLLRVCGADVNGLVYVENRPDLKSDPGMFCELDDNPLKFCFRVFERSSLCFDSMRCVFKILVLVPLVFCFYLVLISVWCLACCFKYNSPVRLHTEREAALHLAAREGSVPALRALLSFGADVNRRDSQGATALMWASVRGHCDAVRTLVEWGADVEARNEDNPEPSWRNGKGRSALIMAAEEGQVGVVEILLEAGANVEAVDARGNTALMVASHRGRTWSHRAVVRLLLSAGACIRASSSEEEKALTFAKGLRREMEDVV